MLYLIYLVFQSLNKNLINKYVYALKYINSWNINIYDINGFHKEDE